MAALNIDFEWSVAEAGYKIETRRRKGIKSDEEEQMIVQCAGPIRTTTPVAVTDNLFLIFSKIFTNEDYIEFANNFGFLTKEGQKAGEEPLKTWLFLKFGLANMIEVWAGDDESAEIYLIGEEGYVASKNIEAVVKPDKDTGEMRLIFRPTSLLDAINLQFAQTMLSNVTANVCKNCGNLFTAGPGGQRSRKDAETCTVECKNNFNNDRKAKLKKGASDGDH